MKSLTPFTLVIMVGMLAAGCLGPRPAPRARRATPAAVAPQTIVTPDNSLSARVVSYNAAGRFVVLSFPVGQKGSKFGQVETTQVRLDQPGWVVTNALVFPWSRIWVNGRRSGGDDLRRQGSFLAVHLPAGTANLRWEWHPDPVWSCLHTISQIAFICVMLVTTFWFVARGLASWARHKT